jgi:DNA-binding NarL/FixJ family response regulator
MRTRILLADDHVLFAQALANLLAERYEVVDIVADGKALQISARKHRPDVLVVDVTMPILSGFDSVRAILQDPYVPKIVFLTMHADPELARQCFNLGGSAFVTKECGSDQLILAIERVMSNQRYLSSNLSGGSIDALSQDAASDCQSTELTSRQREILQLLAEGKTMKEIAAAANLSTRTVEWHKYRMMKMLHMRRTAELIQHAVRMKLVI